MFGLETDIFLLLAFSILAACAFEFVNGFHDTANAVATVIYTNSLKPSVAVVWSGFMNFCGVFFGGIAVAMGIVNLLPVELLIDQNVYHSAAMVFSLLFSAIIWNLGTWYFGLPSSSSHTLIGSILGVGLAFTFMPENSFGSGVNWSKAQELFMSLLTSPIFGFAMAIIIMFILRRSLSKPLREVVFSEPKKNQPPPMWIRAILVTTCTLVSFFHGSNDGQKGVGLVMLILIGIVPAHFAINNNENPLAMKTELAGIEQAVSRIDSSRLSIADRQHLYMIHQEINNLNTQLSKPLVDNKLPGDARMNARRSLLLISRNTKTIIDNGHANLNAADLAFLKSQSSGEKGIRRYTDYAPDWVILMISLSLGLGTMVGWKRIVVTIGEKIGKQHLTYAQGASAELVAASTIGVSSYMGLPVSTTHVLSSGIAGSMVASKGVKNLQGGTIRNIVIAWILTLPVTMVLSGTLYVFFRWIL
ncbi:inorganic phosphate transporter [Dyadobacter sandarakinus]|uniref:Phosphate transporter n=1 Tax=Dyadobacter sandarakinus TaxID=2747268 RepID=A0ABX7IF82_9BACT|nr:inorganic phosphate transporter [Dyadobacter sandarakinus]QRR03531.1 inorganic phosphate transporter [Dyadobacter sandarakinus]